MGRRQTERTAAYYAPRERERAEGEKAQRERGEQYERKLIREIEEEDAALARTALADPPPELSPAERLARENAERIDRLEATGNAQRQPESYRRVESREQYQRKENLRLLRLKKDTDRETARNFEHEKRCAKQISRLEKGVEETDAALAAEDQRHAEARADLAASRAELEGKREALTRALGPNETSEQRLEVVVGV
jgi:hypothetical protein